MSDDAETSALGADSEQSSNTLCYRKFSDSYEWSKRVFSSYVFARRTLIRVCLSFGNHVSRVLSGSNYEH